MTGSENSETAKAGLYAAPNTTNDLGFAVGQRVIATVDLFDLADDECPTTLYAEAGDELIVRQIPWGSIFTMAVSHPNVTGRCFGVRANEIKLAPQQLLIGSESGRSVASGNTSAKTETHMRN